MEQTIENKILRNMQLAKRKKIFFTNDFLKFGNYKACNKALERLVKQEKIMRLSRGIFAMPQKSQIFGNILPTSEDVIRAIMKRDSAKIIPTGLVAENLLGLSTQVPMKMIYLTDGSPRTILIGNTSVILKKTAPKNLATKGKISTLAIQALKSISKEKVTDYEIDKVINHLKKENPNYLKQDIRYAPMWVREIMNKAIKINKI